MRRRLENLWDLCRELGPALLIGGAIGIVLSPFWLWAMDIISGIDCWLYLLVPLGILAVIYPVAYIAVYHRKYSL